MLDKISDAFPYLLLGGWVLYLAYFTYLKLLDAEKNINLNKNDKFISLKDFQEQTEKRLKTKKYLESDNYWNEKTYRISKESRVSEISFSEILDSLKTDKLNAQLKAEAEADAESELEVELTPLKTENLMHDKSLKSVLEVDYFNFDFHLILEYLKLCLKYLIPGLYIGILGYLIYIFYKKIKFVYNCWKTKTLKITFLNWLFDPEILFVTSKLGIFYWICMFVLLGILYNVSGLGYWFTFLFCGRVFIWNWIKFGIYKLNEKWKNKK